MCGFNDLERDEKVARAYQILNSLELKQAICHKILGTTFKDVEKAMEGVIKERQLTPDQEEEIELRESHPEKFEGDNFDPTVTFKKNQSAGDTVKSSGYQTLSREDVARLMAASNAPIQKSEPVRTTEYPTMTREECERLMREHYEHIENEKKRKEERAKWDFPKTIASAPKIEHTTKPTKSTKGSKR